MKQTTNNNKNQNQTHQQEVNKETKTPPVSSSLFFKQIKKLTSSPTKHIFPKVIIFISLIICNFSLTRQVKPSIQQRKSNRNEASYHEFQSCLRIKRQMNLYSSISLKSKHKAFLLKYTSHELSLQFQAAGSLLRWLRCSSTLSPCLTLQCQHCLQDTDSPLTSEGLTQSARNGVIKK